MANKKNKEDKRPSLDSQKLAGIFKGGKDKEVPVLVNEKGVLKPKVKEEEILYSYPSILLDRQLLSKVKVFCIQNKMEIKDLIQQCMTKAMNNEYINIQSAGMLGIHEGDKLGTKIPKDFYDKFKIWMATNNLRLKDVLIHAFNQLPENEIK